MTNTELGQAEKIERMFTISRKWVIFLGITIVLYLIGIVPKNWYLWFYLGGVIIIFSEEKEFFTIITNSFKKLIDDFLTKKVFSLVFIVSGVVYYINSIMPKLLETFIK